MVFITMSFSLFFFFIVDSLHNGNADGVGRKNVRWLKRRKRETQRSWRKTRQTCQETKGNCQQKLKHFNNRVCKIIRTGQFLFLKTLQKKMIFDNMRGKNEKVSFLTSKTVIYKEWKSQKKNISGKFDSDKTLL